MDGHGDSLEARFHDVSAAWRAITNPSGEPDEPRFRTVKREELSIADAGNWMSGPADLLTILGRQRDELFHSRLLAWLLTPTGRHGLGRRFLRALFAEIWPNEPVAEFGAVAVELETTQSGVSGATGDILEARADVVLRTDLVVVVIENKVDAGEQPAQCERLYWAWAQEPVETRWVFLSATGRAPGSVESAEARAAWRPAKYAQVRHALELALGETEDGHADAGRAAARQYLATLEASAYR